MQPVLLLKPRFCLCSGDEGHPQAAPLPPQLARRPGPPRGHHPVHADPGEDTVEETAGAPGVTRDRDGAPGLAPGVEEGMEDPGGDETGQGRGPTTETGTEAEIETGTEKGTGDDILHADEQGLALVRGRVAA